MKRLVIERLFNSFAQLEKAIEQAKQTLASREEPPAELLERIESYEDILTKQRSLATAMCGYASLENWDEVGRHIKLINGLSLMIRDDARDIVGGYRKPLTTEDREAMLS